MSHPPNQSEDFEAQASQERPAAVAEFVDFLRHNKKWWLTPVILALLILGVLMLLGSTAAAPFIYTLF